MLWFDMSQVNWKSVRKNDILYIVLAVMILFGIIFFQEFRRDKLLEQFDTTSAVITSKSSGGYKSNFHIYVKYTINEKNYESDGIGSIQWNDCIDRFRVGDTVLIKYSLKNPKVVAIVDCEKSNDK